MDKPEMEPDSHHGTAALQAKRRSLLWRIHFWAALIATPFALIAALTGILYIFTPQIEASLYRELDTVAPGGELRPLDAAVEAAAKAAPQGWSLHSVVPQQTKTDSVKVAFMPPAGAKPESSAHSGHNHGSAAAARPAEKPPAFLRQSFGVPNKALVVYVNPYTTRVLGRLPQADRFNVWARKLHSTLLQEGWRWMIELAASWVMVMLVTGVFLWWPRGGQSALPRSSARGRVAWKQWHAFAGVSMGLLSVVMLTTGLTWSKHAGEQVRWARDAVGQTPPRIPAQFKSTVPAHGSALSWEQALQAIRREAPEVQMQVSPPAGAEGYWRAGQIDRGQALKRFDLLLDAYSGERLYFSGWDEQTAFGKATAIGIPFHRGEFGWWNQALLLAFGAGVLFSMGSGWVMYFKRRASGSSGLPPVAQGAWKSVSPWAWAGALVMFAAMPLLALSSIAVAAIEGLLILRSRRAPQ
jgi:uncharacterized iron-regulated membrane protein